MVESAPRFALLRTGETTPDANTTECLGYGDGGNGRWRQLQQPEKLSKTEVGSPRWTRFELLRRKAPPVRTRGRPLFPERFERTIDGCPGCAPSLDTSRTRRSFSQRVRCGMTPSRLVISLPSR